MISHVYYRIIGKEYSGRMCDILRKDVADKKEHKDMQSVCKSMKNVQYLGSMLVRKIDV